MLRNGTTWVLKKESYYLPFVIDSKKIFSLVENLKKLFDESLRVIDYEVFYSDGVSEKTQRLDDIINYDNPSNKRITKLKIRLLGGSDMPLDYLPGKQGIETTLQERSAHAAEGGILIETAGPEEWVDVSLMQMREFIKELAPEQPHKFVAPWAFPLFETVRAMAWGFLPLMFVSLCILFAIKAFSLGVGAEVKHFPSEIILPNHIGSKIHYDDSTETLSFRGVMTEKEKTELLGLSDNVTYQKAVRTLYRRSHLLSNAVFWLTVGASLIIIVLLALRLLAYLYPLGVFAIGEGGVRYNKLVDLRGKIFWVVIIGLAITVGAKYIF